MTAAAAGSRLGADSTANYNSGTYGSPTWVGLPVAGDVEFGQTMAEAKVSRRTLKFDQFEPTMLALEFTFDLLEIPADATFEAVRTAFYARTLVDMLFSSLGSATSSENQVRVECKIFDMKKVEPLEGVNRFTLKLKPCFSNNAPTTTILA